MTQHALPRSLRRVLVAVLGLAVAASTAVVLAPPAQALRGASISFRGTDSQVFTSSRCQDSKLYYDWTIDPFDLDGGDGRDYYVFVITDGAGMVQDVDYHDTPTGPLTNGFDVADLAMIQPLTARPLTISVYDVNRDPDEAGDEDTMAAYRWTLERGQLVASDTIDPASVPRLGRACGSHPLVSAAPQVRVVRSPKRVRVRRTRPTIQVAVSVPGRVVGGTVRVRMRKRTWTVPVTAGQASLRLPKVRKRGRVTVVVRYTGDAFTAPATRVIRYRVRR